MLYSTQINVEINLKISEALAHCKRLILKPRGLLFSAPSRIFSQAEIAQKINKLREKAP